MYSAVSPNAARAAPASRYSTHPVPTGRYSHLCGSSDTESASPIPSNRARTEGAIAASAPYAPSACSHNPSFRATPAISPIRSTAPVPAVPALATTTAGANPAARSSRTIRPSAASSIRSSASSGTSRTGPIASSRAAFLTEKCVSSVAYTAPLPFIARAAANPPRFAIDPPLTSSPIPPAGIPISSPSHSTVSRSISVATGPDRHPVTLMFNTAWIRLAAAATATPGDATYPKNRGCALCRLNSATTPSTTCINSPNPHPSRGSRRSSNPRTASAVVGRVTRRSRSDSL